MPMAGPGSIEDLGFVLDSTFFLDAWGLRVQEEEANDLSFLNGALFTTDLIEEELRRRPNWSHKYRVLGLLSRLVRVVKPDGMKLKSLARGQSSRMADWSLIALAEEMSGRRDTYIVSNDTTVAGDVVRTSGASGFLDDESFMLLIINLAQMEHLPWERLVTIFARVRASVVKKAAVDPEWSQQVSKLRAESEVCVRRILASRRSALESRAAAELSQPTESIQLVSNVQPQMHRLEPSPSRPSAERRPRPTSGRTSRKVERYNVTYSGKLERGTEHGIVILGSPGTKQRDRLPSGWIRLRANRVDYWGKFVTIALNVVKESPMDSRQEPNLLDGILRVWFGREGFLPGGRVCHVAFREVAGGHGDAI